MVLFEGGAEEYVRPVQDESSMTDARSAAEVMDGFKVEVRLHQRSAQSPLFVCRGDGQTDGCGQAGISVGNDVCR